MTRINCVPVTELHDRHLVAEYRELPRCFALMYAAQQRGEAVRDKRNPTEYVLGTGHVRFFYDKGLFLLTRQRELVAEMLRRGFNPQHRDPGAFMPIDMDPWRMMDWTPDQHALALNRSRIAERIDGMQASASAA